MSSITKTTGSIAAAPLFGAVRMMSGKIAELRSDLSSCMQTDPLTDTLKDICSVFTKNIRAHALDPAAWESALSTALQNALKDDLVTLLYSGDMPLFEPLLGSDGYVYDKKTLSLFYAEAPEDYQEVSPLTADAGFYVQTHAAAQLSIAWLQKYCMYPQANSSIDAAYDEYRASPYFVPLPEEHNLDVRRSLLSNVKWIKEQEEVVRAAERQIADMEKVIDQITKDISEVELSSLKSHKDLEDKIQSILDDRMQKENAIAEKLSACEKKIADQLARNALLEERVDNLELDIASEKEEIKALHDAIQHAAEAIEDLKERQQSRFFMTCVIGAMQTMLLGTPVLTAILRSAALSVADDLRERMGIPKEVALVAGGMISAGMGASSMKMSMGQALARGAVRGAASVASYHIGRQAPIVADVIEGAADPMLLSKNVTGAKVITSTAFSVTGGGISRLSGIPMALSLGGAGDGKQKIIASVVIQ